MSDAPNGLSAIPDPPPAASKWLDMLQGIILRGLLPVLVLMFVIWRQDKKEDKAELLHAAVVKQMREDLKEEKATSLRLLERLLAKNDTQATEVKQAVKEVKTEVKATTEAVKAAQPAAAP